MSNGIGLIAAERERQITEEGYTTEHDAKHAEALVKAARSYSYTAEGYLNGQSVPADAEHVRWHIGWPWADRDWKPTGDPVRDLVKAGALIAAAIDSLLAEKIDE